MMQETHRHEILDPVAGIVILSWPDLGLSTLAVIIGIVLILRGLFHRPVKSVIQPQARPRPYLVRP